MTTADGKHPAFSARHPIFTLRTIIFNSPDNAHAIASANVITYINPGFRAFFSIPAPATCFQLDS